MLLIPPEKRTTRTTDDWSSPPLEDDQSSPPSRGPRGRPLENLENLKTPRTTVVPFEDDRSSPPSRMTGSPPLSRSSSGRPPSRTTGCPRGFQGFRKPGKFKIRILKQTEFHFTQYHVQTESHKILKPRQINRPMREQYFDRVFVSVFQSCHSFIKYIKNYKLDWTK